MLTPYVIRFSYHKKNPIGSMRFFRSPLVLFGQKLRADVEIQASAEQIMSSRGVLEPLLADGVIEITRVDGSRFFYPLPKTLSQQLQFEDPDQVEGEEPPSAVEDAPVSPPLPAPVPSLPPPLPEPELTPPPPPPVLELEPEVAAVAEDPFLSPPTELEPLEDDDPPEVVDFRPAPARETEADSFFREVKKEVGRRRTVRDDPKKGSTKRGKR